MELLNVGGVKWVCDCYNANPLSMRWALESVRKLSGKDRAFAVLGDMLELGPISEEAHLRIGAMVHELGYAFLFAVGPRSVGYIEGARSAGMSLEKSMHFPSTEGVHDALHGLLRAGDWLLLKGSRGMKMERVLNGFRTLSP
jgi:UDP-N-acetylmuramyl pentapeptide synthase